LRAWTGAPGSRRDTQRLDRDGTRGELPDDLIEIFLAVAPRVRRKAVARVLAARGLVADT